jgi:hypothetical protein
MWSRNYRVLWLSEHSSLSLHNADTVSYPEPVNSTVEPIIPLTSYIPNIHFNPLTSELNPSAQRCLTRFFTGVFASWTVHSVNICVKTNKYTNYSFSLLIMYVDPPCVGITLPSSRSVPSAFWGTLNWGVVDRILWMGMLCLVRWSARAPRH